MSSLPKGQIPASEPPRKRKRARNDPTGDAIPKDAKSSNIELKRRQLTFTLDADALKRKLLEEKLRKAREETAAVEREIAALTGRNSPSKQQPEFIHSDDVMRDNSEDATMELRGIQETAKAKVTSVSQEEELLELAGYHDEMDIDEEVGIYDGIEREDASDDYLPPSTPSPPLPLITRPKRSNAPKRKAPPTPQEAPEDKTPPPFDPNNLTPEILDNVDRAITFAMKWLAPYAKASLVPVFEVLQSDCKADPAVARVLVAVLRQRATAAEWEQFRRFVKNAKKHFKVDRIARKIEEQAGEADGNQVEGSR